MLNEKEAKTLARLLGKIKKPEQGLPLPVFKALYKIVPFVACELVIKNNKGEFLLLYREDEYWQGWHFPGGLIRYNEKFEDRVKRTAKNELGVSAKIKKFIFPINYQVPPTPRGHTVSLVFLCELQGSPKIGKWFKSMPKDIISEHKLLWQQARKSL